jgi:hypothetical protein
MIIYTDKLIPERYDAFTYFFITLIRPKCKDDKALAAHEQVHVQQFWHAPFIHGLLYRFSKAYRQAAEVEAYKVQLKMQPQNLDIFAGYLSNNYDLGITKEQALKLLQE